MLKYNMNLEKSLEELSNKKCLRQVVKNTLY